MRKTFEVATIRRNPDCNRPNRQFGPGRVDFQCISVRELVMLAYSALSGEVVNSGTLRVLGGPGWIDNERYDVSAKADDRPTLAERLGPMLLGLLEDRLQLKSHTEARDTPVFALGVGEGPPRLKPAAEGSCQVLDLENLAARDPAAKYCGFGTSRVDGGTVVGNWWGITTGELAKLVLPMQVGRLVVDRTGLTGRFDVHLEFRRAEADTESTAPTLFAALQRLGLKLTPTTAPVDVVVIDRVERPSDN